MYDKCYSNIKYSPSKGYVRLTVYGYSDYPKLYLDWVNNFLTVEKFAEHYNMSLRQADEIIDLGHKTDNFTKHWA